MWDRVDFGPGVIEDGSKVLACTAGVELLLPSMASSWGVGGGGEVAGWRRAVPFNRSVRCVRGAGLLVMRTGRPTAGMDWR